MKQTSVEEAFEVSYKITGIVSVLVGSVVAFAIGVILIKLLWAWTIPDLFPMAVDQGLIAGGLTWLAAVKAAVLVAILSGTGALVAGRWGR